MRDMGNRRAAATNLAGEGDLASAADSSGFALPSRPAPGLDHTPA